MAPHKNGKQPSTVAREAGDLADKVGEASAASGRAVKRFFVALIGCTVLLIGIAMIALPGPAFIVIPAGLTILATEFLWARRALRQGKRVVERVRRKPWLRRFWHRN